MNSKHMRYEKEKKKLQLRVIQCRVVQTAKKYCMKLPLQTNRRLHMQKKIPKSTFNHIVFLPVLRTNSEMKSAFTSRKLPKDYIRRSDGFKARGANTPREADFVVGQKCNATIVKKKRALPLTSVPKLSSLWPA